MNVFAKSLDQQKEFYKEMLLQQQDNFKFFIPLIMDATNKRLDVKTLKLAWNSPKKSLKRKEEATLSLKQIESVYTGARNE
jgi:hypothetical protein